MIQNSLMEINWVDIIIQLGVVVKTKLEIINV